MITKVGHLIGYLLIILGISEFTPILVALAFNEEYLILPFFICAMLTIFIGLGFYYAFTDDPEKPSRSDIITFLVVVWLVLPIIASIPFMVSGVLTKFTDAYFEATSALTTSGATILANPALAPKTILFWRALLQWQGGIFIFVLAVSMIPLSAIGGADLFKSALPHGEGEGIVARSKSAFKPLIKVYIFFTLICMILLNFSGMGLFDALCTAMATLSSGGFSTHANFGVNSYGNLSEFILIPFMIIAATNLTYHWSFLSSGKFKKYRQDKELSFFLFIFLVATLVIFLTLTGLSEGDNTSLLKKMGIALFTAASALSTTGYLPDGASGMPLGVGIICIILLFIGGTMGSSAGGFKILRLKILFRQANSEISRLAYPHGLVPMRMNDMNVTNSILMSIWTLLFLFLSSIAIISIIYGILGYELHTGIGLTVANLFSAGAMTGLIAPDFVGYNSMSHVGKWLTSITMLLGRIEIIALIIFLSPSFRKN